MLVPEQVPGLPSEQAPGPELQPEQELPSVLPEESVPVHLQ